MLYRFVYDLLLPKGDGLTPLQLTPLDGEVEKFEVGAMFGSAEADVHSSFTDFL